MNSQERYIAHILFKNKVLESDGQAFEDFFSRVMGLSNSNFKPVKPQGQHGDKKNDGFDKIAGDYYQVYAPETLETDKNKSKAVKKLGTTFKVLYDYWQPIAPIKRFFYVMNDKYKGTFPEVEKELASIHQEYKLVECSSFICKNLEDIFRGLEDAKIFQLIGAIPSPENIQDIEYGALNEVVRFLQQVDLNYPQEVIPLDPDFEKKIVINNLSQHVAEFLKQGSYQCHSLKEYFSRTGSGLKPLLREKFNTLYIEAKKEITDGDAVSDGMFFYILKKASPNKKKSVQDCVLVLMAYFFEYCDIFETPQS